MISIVLHTGKVRFIACFLVLAMASGSMAAPEDFAAAAHEYLKWRAYERRFMGAVLVAQKGQVLLQRGYGYADAEWEVPNSPQGLFRLGSLTKMFTAAAVVKLAQDGRVKLTEPVSTYYPETPKAWAKVTLHQLLTHTGGVPNYTKQPGFKNLLLRSNKPEDLIALVQDRPLDFEPGTKWNYSNTGYVLLGRVIERASGLPYATYLTERIFRPLEMSSSGFDTAEPVLKYRARGYFYEPPNLVNIPAVNLSAVYSASGLYSSVGDLLKWDRALYSDRFLPAGWREKIFTGYAKNPIEGKYGYGWFVSEENGRIKYGHEGEVTGFDAMIARYPQSETLVVVLSNLQSSEIGKIGADLARMVFGEKIPPVIGLQRGSKTKPAGT